MRTSSFCPSGCHESKASADSSSAIGKMLYGFEGVTGRNIDHHLSKSGSEESPKPPRVQLPIFLALVLDSLLVRPPLPRKGGLCAHNPRQASSSDPETDPTL
jgi:hypothetical protein